MNNQVIAKLLKNVAAAYILKNEKKYRFQILAYQRASDFIEHSNFELKDAYKEKKQDKLPEIGSSIKAHLEELFEKGEVKHFKDITRGIPSTVFMLLDIPTFGPKKAFKLVTAFKLKNDETVVNDILTIAKQGKIAILPTFGEKSQQDIIRAIEEYKLGKTKAMRMPLAYAFELAKKIVEYLKKSKDVAQVYPLGSLRRMVSTVGDIDIAVASNNADQVINHFINFPDKERIIEKGEVTASMLVSGNKQIDLMVQKPESFGSLLQHFTGSKYHNVALREYALSKGMSLSEYGIKKKMENGKYRSKNSKPLTEKTENLETEEEFYKKLGMQWIPPEIRENQGEIELASKHKLPELVELKDIKGDLHTHSNFPIEPSHDLGSNCIEEMLRKAASLNYEYIGLAEHNPSINNHTKQEIYSILLRRKHTIDQFNSTSKIKNKNNFIVRVINLLEIDILASGDLAIDTKSFDYLDAGIVSIHSSFNMNREKMTERILKGLSHPKIKILAHPTGRMLNERPGYDADWSKIFEFAIKQNIAIEINSWPTRLDLPDNLVKEAKEKGVKFVINTDSHADWQMDNMIYGISVARRGWCEKKDIFNTLPYEKLIKWMKL